MSGTVYVLQVQQPNGPIKIGFTNRSIWERVIAIQQACPYKLKWIAAWPGSRADEKAAHHKLAAYRIHPDARSEWFTPADEVLLFVKDHCPVFDEAKFTARRRIDLLDRFSAAIPRVPVKTVTVRKARALDAMCSRIEDPHDRARVRRSIRKWIDTRGTPSERCVRLMERWLDEKFPTPSQETAA